VSERSERTVSTVTFSARRADRSLRASRRVRQWTTTRVGVLECDHVDPRFVGIGGDAVDMLRTLFATHAPEARLDLVPVDVVAGERPEAPDQFDAWLCPGSRHSVYDPYEWIADTAAFVREVHAAAVPFVGVCFGHQLLAHALGGRVERATSGWGAGVATIAVDAAAPRMDPRAEKLALHFMHQDQVVELPPGGEVLGRADHCPVALLSVGLAAMGVQAHPEFTPAYTDALLADRVARIGDDEVAAARAGLAQPTDEATIVRWMARVLTGG
jgi:GMP synthase-like glutamine amidotransferase